MPAREADRSDLALLEQHVRAAGAIAREYFGGEYRRWSKNRGEPVTEADLAIDRYLNETLREARPGYGWLSEEGGGSASPEGTARAFIIDPIDGTTAFLKGKPHFSISAAVAQRGMPVAGVVYNPIADELYAAAQEGGASLNGAAIRVTDCARIEGCRMLGAKEMFAHPAWSVPPNEAWPAMQLDQRSSIAWRMALVAAGTFDAAVVVAPKHDWDMAAGDLIVREAGGCVTAHDGSRLRYGGPSSIQRTMICAGPTLHALLVARLKHIDLTQR